MEEVCSFKVKVDDSSKRGHMHSHFRLHDDRNSLLFKKEIQAECQVEAVLEVWWRLNM